MEGGGRGDSRPCQARPRLQTVADGQFDSLYIHGNKSPDRRPIVISGPSGVGKGTLIQRLLAKYPETFATTVSHTTRQPRPGEIDGEAYHFVSKAEFSALVAQNAFVEHTEFNNNYYGTSKQTVLDQGAKGSIVLLDIDIEGAKAIEADSTIQARYVFIRPPSFETLRQRLRGRGTEDEASVERRLKRSQAELEEADRTGLYELSIVNDKLGTAYEELVHFIFGGGLH